MKIVEEINKRIDLLRRIDEAKKMIDNLTIDWATDPKEMEFEKLYGGGGLLPTDKFIGMDKIKIEPNPEKEALFESMMDSERIVNLIELMASGKKIIPPLHVNLCSITDGVKVANKHEFMDGSHRKRLAAFLQLEQIPVVVFERIGYYIFTPEKWRFEAREKREDHSGGCTITKIVTAISKEGVIVELPKNKPLYLTEDDKFIKICVL